MFRKLFAVLTLVLALPAFANAAWTVKASSANPTYGTVTPSGYNAYADSDKAAKTFTVTPGGNYQVSGILVDNVDVKSGTGTQTVSVPYKFGTTILVAKFTAKQYSVTAGSITGKGSITSTSPVLVNAGASKTFSILPNPGNRLVSVQDNGTEVTPVSASGMSYTVSNVQGPHVITATFGGVTANAGVAQNTISGVAVTLNGSGTAFNTPTYKWTVVYAPVGSGLTAGAEYATVAQPTFNKTVVGTYNFKLEVADSVDTTAKAYASTSVNVYADYKAAALATVNSCIVCHAPQAEFTQSYHWNNHLEVGPEFTGGAVEGQLNANESWTTYEDGKLTTCSGRCHFKSKTNAVGCNTCHASGQFNGSTLQNTSVLGMNAPLPNTTSTCLVCHSGSKHGKVPNEFFGSAHWQNHFEYGAEFADQTDVTVNGGVVTPTGTKTAGYLNANDSYTTTEDGGVVTCAYRCHFRPGQGPVQNYGTYLKDGHSTTYVTYTDTTGKYGEAGKVYSRPGGNSCMACHDPHGLEATAQSTCYTCHAGGNHGWSVAAFEKSLHFTGTYAKYDGMDKESCVACHEAHSLEAGFAVMSSATVLDSTGAATNCQKCHTPGAPYAIFNADLTGKAPHFNTTGTTGYAYVQDMADPNNTAACVDCHYHDNTVNVGWGLGGHGSKSSPWNRLSATDKSIDLQAQPWVANDACARCHSAKGYAYFVNSGFKNMTTINPVVKINAETGLAYNTYSPLTCNGCHVAKTAGTTILRGDLRGSYGAGFKGTYGVNNTAYFTGPVVDSIQYADNKKSNGCMPCHSPRNTIGQNIKTAFTVAGADAKKSAGVFSAHHGDYVGPVFNGKGGYDFTVSGGGSDFAYQDRARHQRIGNYGTDPLGYNGTTNTKGSCVFCHMNSAETHSLEITADTYTNACAKCHPSDFGAANLTAAAAENAAALKALKNLIDFKTWQATGTLAGNGTDMTFNAAGVLTGDNAIAEKNIGANFNYSMLTAGDAAAYAHNPSYARRLISDSIDWLDDNVLNGSANITIFKNLSSATYLADSSKKKDLVALSATEVAAANIRLNNPGCMGCHFGTGSVANGEAIPGVEQAPHYNTTGAVVPGQTFTQAQFVVPGAQCNSCHGYGHGTDSPSYSFSATAFPKATVDGVKPNLGEEYAESAHGDINGLAWTDYDFKQAGRDNCTVCHTTTGFVNAVSSNFTNTAAWGTSADTSKQVLACNACHSSTSWKTSVRSVNVSNLGAVSPISYDNAGESNVCIPCHATRENTTTVNAATGDFANMSFKNSHYLGAAAVFYGKGGFQFYTSGVRYNTYGAAGKVGRNANWSHGRLGMDNYTTTTNATVKASGVVYGSGNKGQCVACHLGPINTHTFGAAEVANATLGTSSNTRGCYGCHTSTTGTIQEFIEEEKVIWDRMMDFFDYTLKQNNLRYTPNYPYFQYDKTQNGVTAGATVKNWTSPATGPNGGTGKQTMGAALNYKLLAAEPGKHVHNRSFGRALIADSIVYLQNGAVGDRSVAAEDVNSIINFSNYSAANPVGNGVSITTLKSYLTKAASIPGKPDGFARR